MRNTFIFFYPYNGLLAQNGKFKEKGKHKATTRKQMELQVLQLLKTNYERNVNMTTATSPPIQIYTRLGNSSAPDAQCVLCY
jgi:hypothetical protein